MTPVPTPRRHRERQSNRYAAPEPDRVHSAGHLLRQARSAFYREDEDEALDLLLEAMHIAPSNLHAHYLAALCADLLSEEDTLDDVCAHALETDARHPYTIACEAVRYLYLSNFSRAEDLFNQALRRLPDELDIQIGLGILHEYSGDEEKGMAAFRRALELDPNNVRARVSLGVAYAMSGEYQSALAEYSRAKAIDPSIENPHERLGRDYYLDGMIEEATSEFGRAMAEEPDEPAAYFYQMDCLNRLGRLDDALDRYQTIRQRFGDQPELTSGFYEYFHMRQEARAALEMLVGRNPNDPDLRVRLSNLHRESGQLDQAIAAAEAANKLDPESHETIGLLGSLYFEHGDYHEAIDSCHRATQLDPYDQAAYVTLADSLLFLGRDEESQAAVEEMERNRQEAWRRYQDRFSGQDRADAGF
ncbi:MAG TPA: tetratricopeptide repeat protein [bacterium]|nr:tetratricopeptide repeat protein [bacterium]